MPSMQMEPQQETVRATHYEQPTQSAYERAGEPKKTQQQILEELEKEKRRQAEEERRIAAEKQEEAKRIAAEKVAEAKRIAAERQKVIDAHYSFLRDQWIQFQKKDHDFPPALLALEAENELEPFREFVRLQSARVIEPVALKRFEDELRISAREGGQIIDSIKTSLRSGSLLDKLFDTFNTFNLGYLDSTKIRDLLKKCVVSLSVPDLGSPAREAVKSARKFLRRAWSKKLEQDKQAFFSIHRCAGKTIFHLGSGRLGSIFVTLPSSLEPEALAEAFVSRLKRAAVTLFNPESTIAVVDGAHQNINYNHVFPDNIVVRSIKDDCDSFEKNMNTMLERQGPTCENSSMHLGIPANEDELAKVFPAGGADWDLWSGMAELWKNHANLRGFDRPNSARADEVLQSLATSKNVIIVIAHANENTLYLPAPPPEGSRVSTDQVLGYKDKIMANKPLVYLFCCESAEISNLKSFAQVLLECGASGVIAPQTKIDAGLSVALFDGLLDREALRTNALAKLQAAKQKSGYREMEVFLG